MEFKCLLAKNYNDSININGYWCSEKLDGIRSIYYNGSLYSRTNKIINAPSWFIKKIQENVEKETILDGELYTIRNDFSNITSIISKHEPIDSEWSNISLNIFDIPNINQEFESR